ncbi:anthranilate synthase family protein [Kribbella sp. NBC_00382]|uniref:anthranilate synthase family protein n=1 Tax=Kribbella sp. NBC_00382 TaxID=2975967 RepID=UPI002E1E5722
MTALLDQVLADGNGVPPFALLYRPETAGRDRVDLIVGESGAVETLADIPLAADAPAGQHETLVLVPYRQLAERGFQCTDDGAPLLVLQVAEQAVVPLDELMRRLPNLPTPLVNGRFDVEDETYAEIVRRVVEDEIGTGEGANFVIKRSFTAEITGYGVAHALSFFRRLLSSETGAYWTFVVHTGDRTFVGATPERHVSVSGGTAVMNPISGTYRYPASGPTLDGVLGFLADGKETDELYMVVDEELKMMARVCDGAGTVVGPFLKEMARLAHTEYLIEGRTSRDVREILRETLFAPTVTGSPLESACKVISRHELNGRGYYSGVVALIGSDPAGGRTMDSSILIRTAEISSAGRLSIGVGATLVRHSDPLSEVAETRAKAAGLLAALAGGTGSRFADHPEVRSALQGRNAGISGFWFNDRSLPSARPDDLAGRSVLVIDAEDTFTSMIAHQLSSLGLTVTVRRYDEPYRIEDHDLVVAGPGPGDPGELQHPKIAHLQGTIKRLIAEERPFLAVCLSHQVLCGVLGLEVERCPKPNQGVQKEIDLFGRPTRVGFYNTFAARSATDRIGDVEISRNPVTNEVHALRGPRFASMQFHAESVLTEEGVLLLHDAFSRLLASNVLVSR